MKTLTTFFFLLIALGPAVAQDFNEMDYGEAEYMNSCAACHGPKGIGNGPLAAELRREPADLTVLSDGNDGRFPYWRVFAVIDGRYIVPGHGDRDMPVWGETFKLIPGSDAAAVKARIEALVRYLQGIQERAL